MLKKPLNEHHTEYPQKVSLKNYYDDCESCNVCNTCSNNFSINVCGNTGNGLWSKK